MRNLLRDYSRITQQLLKTIDVLVDVLSQGISQGLSEKPRNISVWSVLRSYKLVKE